MYLSGQQLQNGNLITLCIRKESLSNDDGDGNKNGKKTFDELNEMELSAIKFEAAGIQF